MNEQKTILQFDDVTLGDPERNEIEMESVGFRLGPGDSLVVETREEAACPPIAAAAQGILEPMQGCVRFMGEDWRAMTADAVASHRSRIGRVYESHAWVSNLDLDENITLARRHHSRQPIPEIIDEARALARRFGLEDLPAVRPAWAKRREWRISQWVRALLGKPSLLLLERPTREAADEECSAWIAAVEEAREQGAAVLWVLSDQRVLRNQSIRPARHARFENKRLIMPAENPT